MRRGEDGTTMVELVVAMVVLSMVMVAFMSILQIMARTTARVTVSGDATSQARRAFDDLTRSLPFATAVNTPTVVGSDWYLEAYTTAVSATTTPSCTQWRWQPATGLFQRRDWSTATSTPTPTAWTTLARYVANDPAVQPPFTVYATDAAFTVPRVRVALVVARPGAGRSSVESTFALRNAIVAPSTLNGTSGPDVVCTQVARG